MSLLQRLRAVKIAKTITEGQLLPAWYGIAWRDFYRNTAVCYPVPLNLIAAVGRAAGMFAKHGARTVHSDPRAAYDQGFKAGRASVGGWQANVVVQNFANGGTLSPEAAAEIRTSLQREYGRGLR